MPLIADIDQALSHCGKGVAAMNQTILRQKLRALGGSGLFFLALTKF